MRQPPLSARSPRRRPVFALALCGLMGCAPPATTSDPRTPTGSDAAPDVQGEAGTSAAKTGAELGAGTRYLQIQIAGQPVGGLGTNLQPTKDGGLRSTDRFRISMERVNSGVADRFVTETLSETLYGPGYVLMHDRDVTIEGDVETIHDLTFEADQLIFRYSGPGRTDEQIYPLPDGFRSSLSVFHELREHADAGGSLPKSITYEDFDTNDERFESRTLTMQARLEDVPRPDGSKGLGYRLVETDEDGSLTRALVDERDIPLEVVMFDGTMRAIAVADDPFAVDHYAQITSEMPVDGTVQRWWELEMLAMRVSVEGDDPERPPLFPNNHYHHVKRDGTNYDVELTATKLPAEYRAPTLPFQKVPADVKKYLRPTKLSQSDDPQIVAMAQRLADGATDPIRVARSINTFVFRGLEKKSGARGNATATEVLEQRAGDCTEHAALTVALMRAAGIPARNVSGIVYLTGERGEALAGYHAWAEVWLGRWVGVDAVFGEMGTSARYLMTGYHEPGEREDDGVGRTLGRIKMQVTAYRRFGEEKNHTLTPSSAR